MDWIVTSLMSLSLVVFIMLSYRSFRVLFVDSVDSGISDLSQKLDSSLDLKNKTELQLVESKQEQALVVEKYDLMVESARADSNVMIESAKAKVINMKINAENTIAEYTKYKDLEIMDEVKKKIKSTLEEIVLKELGRSKI